MGMDEGLNLLETCYLIRQIMEDVVRRANCTDCAVPDVGIVRTTHCHPTAIKVSVMLYAVECTAGN